MLIDLHVHELKYSSDSHISLDDILKKAKEVGLDGVCITNHDNNFIRNEIDYYQKKYGITVIAGAEILSRQGDILAFVNDTLHIEDNKIDADELLDYIDYKNGVSISAHPFRNNNRGLGYFLKNISAKLSAVESFNGSTLSHHNLYGFALAKELNIPSTGGSDAHVLDNVGKFATYFKDKIRDEMDFIEAIKSREFFPAIHKGNHYEIVNYI
ncbi:MAG TPA: PHP domain-containing protein [Soehngenia sp.]|nr:PHP domain-containing protein [Soehngenia sp.]HPP30995.1 PHP domain-containing protein [Soehngenia sp.]